MLTCKRERPLKSHALPSLLADREGSCCVFACVCLQHAKLQRSLRCCVASLKKVRWNLSRGKCYLSVGRVPHKLLLSSFRFR